MSRSFWNMPFLQFLFPIKEFGPKSNNQFTQNINHLAIIKTPKNFWNLKVTYPEWRYSLQVQRALKTQMIVSYKIDQVFWLERIDYTLNWLSSFLFMTINNSIILIFFVRYGWSGIELRNKLESGHVIARW